MTNDMKDIDTKNNDMKKAVLIMVWLPIFGLGLGFGYWSCSTEMKREAVKHGAGGYNETTGAFEWRGNER